jgi:uncharacterized membrane protein
VHGRVGWQDRDHQGAVRTTVSWIHAARYHHHAMNDIDRDRDPLEFGRVLALSDGIFAIAITLLVISIAVPVGLARDAFHDALLDLLPRILVMALSIFVVGSAWIEHHRSFGLLQRIDRRLVVLNIGALGLVAFVPLPHQVLGAYPHEPMAYVLYAVVLGSLNAMFIVMDAYVRRAGLLRTPMSDEDYRNELIRGTIYVTGFAVSIPLAFVLVGLTPIIWVLSLPLDVIVRSVRASRAESSAAHVRTNAAEERVEPD